MKNHQSLFFIFSLHAILFFTQCDNNKEDCKDTLCTEEFRAIGINLMYPDETPVILDNYTVFWKSEKKLLTKPASWDNGALHGYYMIVNDNMILKLRHKEEVFQFTGFLNSKEIFTCEVLVGADCCHVQHLGSEPLTYIIEK